MFKTITNELTNPELEFIAYSYEILLGAESEKL